MSFSVTLPQAKWVLPLFSLYVSVVNQLNRFSEVQLNIVNTKQNGNLYMIITDLIYFINYA